MCGIVGYVGPKSCVPLIFEGLQNLEYRGYDSSGIVALNQGRLHLARAEGKLSELKPKLTDLPESGLGIGHTRWATHGRPTTENAHPHVLSDLGIVQNGIIENYKDLKEDLESRGVKFVTQTDTEAILHVLDEERRRTKTPLEAIFKSVKRLEGSYAFAAVFLSDPEAIYVVKLGCPAVIGLGTGENYFASDALAIVKHTQKAVFLNDGEVARIRRDGIDVFDMQGRSLKPRVSTLNCSPAAIEKRGFRHFMLKEIHEQPSVVASTISRLVDRSKMSLNRAALGLDKLKFDGVRNVSIVACGTAYHAGLVARYCLESDLGLPVSVDLASEFRYRKPHLDENTLVISISQSGETADTLASVRHSLEQGCQVLSVCNVQFSAIPRASSATLYMEAGPEIGVASTKAFTSQILCLYLISLAVGRTRGMVSDAIIRERLQVLERLPLLVDHALNLASVCEEIATHYYESKSCLYLGRGAHFPIALEGALKLKEISYIHAEGYAGGELKHGPIALVDRHMPIIAIAPRDGHYEKMISNIEEVRAREGQIIGVGGERDERLRAMCSHYIPCPEIQDPIMQTILSTIPLQLLSYHMAVRRGTDVDQPRNLAKSVTVE